MGNNRYHLNIITKYSKIECASCHFTSMLSKFNKVDLAFAPRRDENQKHNITPYQQSMIGMVSALISRTAASPLDVLKTLAQVSESGGSVSEHFAKIMKEDGIKGLWRGNAAGCIRYVPQKGIQNYVQPYMRWAIHGSERPTQLQTIAVGSLTAMISQGLTYPLDVVRTRVTVNPQKYKGFLGTFATMISEEGPGSLFAGILPTFYGIVPWEGGRYFAQVNIENFMKDRITNGAKLTTLQVAVKDGMAATFGQVLSYPFEVVRKRMMVKGETKRAYNGTFHALSSIAQNEGIPGLYRGFSINLIRVVPMQSLEGVLKAKIADLFVKYCQWKDSNK